LAKFEFALTELWGFVFVLVRTAGILSALPIIGTRMVPMRIKAGLVIAVAMVFAPLVGSRVVPEILEPISLAVGLTAELIIGIVLGFATRLLMAAVEMAGSIMGLQLGFAVAVQLDPVNQVEVPVLGSFLTVLMTLLYFVVDGHHLIMFALGSSFTLIPPFGAHLSASVVADGAMLMDDMFALALKLTLPIMASTFLVYLVLGIIGRVMPQMNILFTAFPITIGVGLMILGLGLPLFSLMFQQTIIGLEQVMVDMMKEMGRG
jgi:flagellar biosynthetic protein FliR